ncbi:MAG TPA: hypothetical protein DCP92_08045 [Nitrospiraceae bacterium]|jgi:hypothetical protein|nr:hypothetical protein [Nitrospiraceae bacterium]
MDVRFHCGTVHPHALAVFHPRLFYHDPVYCNHQLFQALAFDLADVFVRRAAVKVITGNYYARAKNVLFKNCDKAFHQILKSKICYPLFLYFSVIFSEIFAMPVIADILLIERELKIL